RNAREPEDSSGPGHRTSRRAADARLVAAGRHHPLGGPPEGRGRCGSGGRSPERRRRLQALFAEPRGVHQLAARGRPQWHARPQGHPNQAIPRPVRAPAALLSAAPRARSSLPNPEQPRSIARLRCRNGRRVSPAGKQEGKLMGIIVWLIVGGVVGWLASLIMRTDAQQGIILNIVVGIIGAVIAGLLGKGNINGAITIETFIWSLVGAIILLVIVNLIRRGTVR